MSPVTYVIENYFLIIFLLEFTIRAAFVQKCIKRLLKFCVIAYANSLVYVVQQTFDILLQLLIKTNNMNTKHKVIDLNK